MPPTERRPRPLDYRNAPPGAPRSTLSGLAIASVVCAALSSPVALFFAASTAGGIGILLVLAFLTYGLVFGYVAMRDIGTGRGPLRGRVLAVVGFWTNLAWLGFYILGVAVFCYVARDGLS